MHQFHCPSLYYWWHIDSILYENTLSGLDGEKLQRFYKILIQQNEQNLPIYHAKLLTTVIDLQNSLEGTLNII